MDIVRKTFEVADSVKNNRKPSDILLYATTELGECAEELLISTGYSHKKPGADGVIGEAIDTIICLLDLIRVYDPEITVEELENIATKKLQKWKDKS